MQKIATALLLAGLALPALADTYTFGNRVVADGDGTGKLVEVAGKPDQVSPAENGFGAKIGEKWTYFRDGKTLVFTVDNNGKIVSISETR